jgi:N-methylhydantoinase B/oxoprolinase/acetone carboxylase alpha subunit
MTLEVTDKNLNNNNINFGEQETKKEIKKALLNNLTNYETEKLGDLRASISELVKTLEIIEEYIKKADKL